MIKEKMHPGMLILMLTTLLFSACSESGQEFVYTPESALPNPAETPGPTPAEMTPDEVEIESGETCSFIIPKTLALSAIASFPCYDINDDYIQIHLPQNLCVRSYPDKSEGYYIVMFTGPIYDEYKRQIESLGGILHSYIPANGFIVNMSESIKDEVEGLEIVRWVGIYQPAYKISVDVKWSGADPPVREVSMPLLTRTGIITLIVGVFNGENVTDIANRIESFGGIPATIYETSQNKLQVSIDATRIPDIANIPGVEYISEYRIPVINEADIE